MRTYKGFNKDMTCRGFEYEEGKEYETNEAVVCEIGFHACEHPLDCFRYYAPSESVYCEVEQDGDIDRDSDNKKVASTKIKIGAKLDITGIVRAAIEFTKERINEKLRNKGYCGASSATGYYGVSSATGYKGASSVESLGSVAVAWGYKGKAKGVIGSYLVLANWQGDENEYWNQESWRLNGAKMVYVDGEIIKENTYYTMINGEIVEARE